MLEIPYQRLPEETLRAIIEEFVTRDGTDYGLQEASLAQKIADVEGQIVSGQVVIVYDERSESCQVLTREQLREQLLSES